MEFEALLLSLSYIGLLILMIPLGVTGIFPPSKVVYIIVGYLVYVGHLNLFGAILSGALGHTIGNYIQFILTKKYGLNFFTKWKIFPKKEIMRFQIAFNERKVFWLFAGKILDPIKMFISICAAIANVSLKLFLPIAFVGSAIWATIFILFGFYFGKSFVSFGWLGLIIIILGATVMLGFYKYMNSEYINKKLNKENKRIKTN